MEINICIPTLNSYDTLVKCIESVRNSSVKVNRICIIDNGGGFEYPGDDLYILKMQKNLGVAASWNRFIKELSEHRIICNDDIEFHKDSIEVMINSYDPNSLVFPDTADDANAFSCFLLPQNIINSVGLFDERISPEYAYFEDNDYHRRMLIAGFSMTKCNTMIEHVRSSTVKHFSSIALQKHHRKFQLAESNYRKKWGGLPGSESKMVPSEI